MLRATVITLTAVSALLGGCGHRYFSNREINPVIEDRVGTGGLWTEGPKRGKVKRVGVLSTRADRRTILFLEGNKFCAEPPPDVAEAVSSTIMAKLSTERLDAAAAAQFQTAVMQLTKRSQGLEFFRTGSFVLCNMHVNGELEGDAYRQTVAGLLTSTQFLIEKEIGKLPETGAKVEVTSKPTDLSGFFDATKAPDKPQPATAPATAPQPSAPPATPGAAATGGSSTGSATTNAPPANTTPAPASATPPTKR